MNLKSLSFLIAFVSTSSIFSLSLPFSLAHGAVEKIRPDRIYTADSKKRNLYLREGLIKGGDRAINDVIVLGIRRAKNSGFERVVLDLEGNRNGDPVAIDRPPYYQVSVSPELNRLSVTLWGGPTLAFDAKKTLKAFEKSQVIQELELLPVLQKDRWTFSFNMKKGYAVEVFELSNPVRLIVDIQSK